MKKNSKRYVTIKNNGIDFRKLAEIMTVNGYKMNHATVRNQLMLAIETLMNHMSSNLDAKLTKKNIKTFLASQENHDDLSDVIYKAYKELEKESEND